MLITIRLKNRQRYLGVLSLFTACSLTACATVEFTSRPTGADIVLAIPGQESGKIIGKTPLSGSVSDIAKSANKSTVVVTIKKSGFKAQSFVIPNLGSGKLEIDASLQPVGADDAQDINLAVRYVLEAEKEIIDKNFPKALKALEKAKAANPNIAAAYMFEGIIYNLQQDKPKAREALLRALALDPTDTDVRSLLNEIGGESAPAAPVNRRGRK